MNELNAGVVVMTLFISGLAAALWLSPDLMDKATKRLHARAGALRRAREAYKATHESLMQEPLQGFSGAFGEEGR
jgi:hypothetical protein